MTRILTSDALCAVAQELEENNPKEAEKIYIRILTAGEHPASLINLGRLKHNAGRVSEAYDYYSRALKCEEISESERAMALFNIGVALYDMDVYTSAVEHYLKATQINPDFADAYYNLAVAYSHFGNDIEVMRHIQKYKKLTGDCSVSFKNGRVANEQR